MTTQKNLPTADKLNFFEVNQRTEVHTLSWLVKLFYCPGVISPSIMLASHKLTVIVPLVDAF